MSWTDFVKLLSVFLWNGGSMLIINLFGNKIILKLYLNNIALDESLLKAKKSG